jgi:hypothetical protein
MDAQPGTIPVNGADLSNVEQGPGSPVVFVRSSLSDFREAIASSNILISRQVVQHAFLCKSAQNQTPRRESHKGSFM